MSAIVVPVLKNYMKWAEQYQYLSNSIGFNLWNLKRLKNNQKNPSFLFIKNVWHQRKFLLVFLLPILLSFANYSKGLS